MDLLFIHPMFCQVVHPNLSLKFMWVQAASYFGGGEPEIGFFFPQF
jgi:hypothetical protein